MAKDDSVATRRKEAVACLLESAQWVAGDVGFKVNAPPAHRDVEIQRISLLEYAAAVLNAVRESRQAARQTDAGPAAAPEAEEAAPADAKKKAARR